MIVAGIDEAGYGPTLGPLVVSVCALRIPEETLQARGKDLWSLLEPVVCREREASRIQVNDSKKVFQQKKGLQNLEESLLPFLCLRRRDFPPDLRSLLRSVGGRKSGPSTPASGGAASYLEEYPWYRGRDVELPVETFAGFVRSRSRKLQGALEAAGVDWLGLAARPVEVLEFNRELDRARNKSRVSFRVIGDFIRRLWQRFPGETVEVTVDRQGGRSHYGPLLFEAVRPRGIRIETQTAQLSIYELNRRVPTRPVTDPVPRFIVAFEVESESRRFPVALASMLSKYLRELHMLLFNRFWREHRSDLKPTAGYAKDARRFLQETSALRRRLAVDDVLLVRRR